MRRRSMVALLAALIIMTMALGATAASAGEVTGKGNATAAPDNANSICAFSGQNDGFHDSEDAEYQDPQYRVQSWGQIPKAFRDAVLIPAGEYPGNACRGGANHHD